MVRLSSGARGVMCQSLRIWLQFVLLFAVPHLTWGQESAVFRLVVNTEDRGETFAVVAADGEVMVPRSTLTEIRLQDLPSGETIHGEPHVSLRALAPAVTYAIDQDTSTLTLTVAPERFSKTVREYFFNQPPPNLRTTFSNSAFLNYSLIATDEKSLAGTAEVAARMGHWLGQSTFVYTKTESTENARRLLSTMSHDSPDDQRRITIGDVSAFSGLLGSGGVLGGIGVSRNFGLTPYFYPTPGLNLSGLLETPSEVETYVNGRLVKREHLSPGAFTLQNVPVNNGLNNTTIVIRDAFQRVTQINAPFYMSPQLLKQGLSDYSYNVGFRRSNLGLESNDYREWQAIASHRYGWTPWLTAGFRGEMSAQRTNIGPLSSLRLGAYGQLDTNFAVSRDHSTVGYGALASYTYSSGVVSVRGSVQYLSRDYANLATSAGSDKPKLAWLVSVGGAKAPFGSLTATYSETTSYVQSKTSQVSGFYSRPLYGPLYLQVSVSQTFKPIPITDVFVGVTFTLGSRHTGLLTQRMRDREMEQTAVLQRNPPLGPGLAYRLQGSRLDPETGPAQYSTDDFIQYQGTYGTVGAAVRERQGRLSHDLRLAGSVSLLDNRVHLSRPIIDSFALVRVPELKNVEVAFNNQSMGTTNRRGELVIPEMISYLGNNLSIDPNALPVEYQVDRVRQYVAPAFRSGALVEFDVTKLQAFVGKLMVLVEGKLQSGDYAELTVKIPGKKDISGFVGTHGQFYLENLPTGRVPLQVDWQGKVGLCELTVPKSDEIQVDVGTITCVLSVSSPEKEP